MPPIRTFFRGNRNPIGIEIEVENSHPKFTDKLLHFHGGHFWTWKEDGSLKNKGMEYISKPLTGVGIDYGLWAFAEAAKFWPLDHSNRCSTHVHVNVSHYSWDNLSALISVYGLIENVVFSLVDPKRKGNPFCFPITGMTPNRSLCADVTDNSKYCALNTAPIKSQLTVEFRQLNGTNDYVFIRRWIQMLLKLVKYCSEVELSSLKEILAQLAYSQAYEGFLKSIFGQSVIMFSGLNVNQLCHENLLWAQLVLED